MTSPDRWSASRDHSLLPDLIGIIVDGSSHDVAFVFDLPSFRDSVRLTATATCLAEIRFLIDYRIAGRREHLR